MLAHRIAVAAAAMAVLAAPAAAFATNSDGATPTATPLLLELAVAALVVGGLLARRRLAHRAPRRLVAARPDQGEPPAAPPRPAPAALTDTTRAG